MKIPELVRPLVMTNLHCFTKQFLAFPLHIIPITLNTMHQLVTLSWRSPCQSGGKLKHGNYSGHKEAIDLISQDTGWDIGMT